MSTTPTVTEDGRQNKVTFGPGTNITAHRCHQVIATSGDAAVRTNSVPQLGHLYVNERGKILSPFLLCTSATFEVLIPATRTKSGFFAVHTEYGLPDNGGNDAEPQPGGPPVDYWRGAGVWEPCDFDVDDNPLIYSNKRPIEPPPTAAVGAVTLTIRHVVKRFKPATLINFLLHDTGRCPVNDAVFRGAPAGTCLYLGFDEAPRDDGYVELGHEFMVKQNADMVEVLDHDAQGSLFFKMNPSKNFGVLGVGR